MDDESIESIVNDSATVLLQHCLRYKAAAFRRCDRSSNFKDSDSSSELEASCDVPCDSFRLVDV